MNMIVILACVLVAALIIALSILLRKVIHSIVCDECPNKPYCENQKDLDKDFVPPCEYDDRYPDQFRNDGLAW